MNEKRKVILVDCGFINMNVTCSFLNTKGTDELVLIDVDREKAIGEAVDLQHGLPYARGKMGIKTDGYEECRDAAVVVITAGVTQRPTGTHLGLIAKDAVIMESVTEQTMTSGFDGTLAVISNLVDAMTYVVRKVSGLPTERIIGSETVPNTAHLRYIISEYLDVSISNICVYVMGEHGDSSLMPWTDVCVDCKNLLGLLDEKGRDLSDLHGIYTNVQQTGYEIVKYKRSTYYGIGPSPNRLVHAILDDEGVILTVPAYQNNKYDQEGLYTGILAVVNRRGIRKIVKLDLSEVDQAKFNRNCETVHDINTDAVDPLPQRTNSVLLVQCTENGKSGISAYKDQLSLDCG